MPFTARICTCLLAVLLIQPWLSLRALSLDELQLSAEAAQCADILGIHSEIDQIIAIRRTGASGANLNKLRSRALRRIFQGILEVQVAESRLEMEQAYTYDVMQREQRKINTVDQLFNIANFLQFGVLYTLEPWARINHQFKESAIFTTTGGGVGLLLPILNILYDKTARAKNLKPPDYLSHIVDGKPVDGSHLPPYVMRYLDAPALGTQMSRRAALNEIWNKRYHADIENQATLCGIDDGKSKKMFTLHSRIVLLWSLYTTVQGFNRELLALLDSICDYRAQQGQSLSATTMPDLGPGASEAARLLHVETLVGELRSTPGATDDVAVNHQLALMEYILCAYLDMRIGEDRCQEELNYQSDVVLAQMNARRGKFLQRTYEANFIQGGILGTCAGYNYLHGRGQIGNELFCIANGIGIGITTISLIATQGGWKKNDRPPNSLADLFNLRANSENGFSPLVRNYLSDTGPDTGSKTRRQFLEDVWSKNAVVNMDLSKERNREKLGSMPSCKYDTIRLVNNRIALLSSLREQFGHFDAELLELLRKSWPTTITPATITETAVAIDHPRANEIAGILGVQSLIAKTAAQATDQQRLLLTRDVLEGFLGINCDAAVLNREVLIENQVMHRMIRQRDMAIQFTNILNFYQIGILGVISDSLGLSSHSYEVLAGDEINIVSGFLVSCLALTALLERHGGVRPNKAEPNLLSNLLNVRSQSVKLTPLTVHYLDSKDLSSTGMTYRQELIKYWQNARVLNVNVKNVSTDERLSAEGKANHWWNETINLINNRITMLYDLRAIIRTSNIGFDDLLTAIE